MLPSTRPSPYPAPWARPAGREPAADVRSAEDEDTMITIVNTAIKLQIDQAQLDALKAAKQGIARRLETLTIEPKNGGWGVSGNTWRAIKILDEERPSQKYKEWAKDKSITLIRKNDFKYETELNEVRNELNGILLNHLDDAIRVKKYYFIRKISDLFFLRMASYRDMPQAHRNQIIAVGNCPLDSRTLANLGRLVPGLVAGGIWMSAIDTEAKYSALQGVIRQITRLADMPNIYFDLWERP
jgi:hypothetical protein